MREASLGAYFRARAAATLRGVHGSTGLPSFVTARPASIQPPRSAFFVSLFIQPCQKEIDGRGVVIQLFLLTSALILLVTGVPSAPPPPSQQLAIHLNNPPAPKQRGYHVLTSTPGHLGSQDGRVNRHNLCVLID